MVRKGRDFQEDINRGEERNEEDRKPANELRRRKSAPGWQTESPKHKISDHIYDGSRDYLIEGVLDETAKPAPEEPFHLRNDKKRNEDRAYQNANRGGDEAVSDDYNRYGLCRGKQDGHDDVDRSSQKISPTGGVHAGFEIGNLRDHRLQLRLSDRGL